MKRMLINVTHGLRIATVDGQHIEDFISAGEEGQKKETVGNVYKAVVTRVEDSLQAAFVEYGGNRQGFLPFKEIPRSCFKSSYVDTGRRPSINEVLEEGQELIVQVEKEERGNKGAALSGYISLLGRYVILMPTNPRAGGVSRRIEGEERDELSQVLSSLQVPEGMGLIIRTAGGGRSQEELQWDLEGLLRLWSLIEQTAKERPAPFLIYQESNAVIRALRDYLPKDIDEILIDDRKIYEEVINHIKPFRPELISRIKLYHDAVPLFTRFQVESQIESAFKREVSLPSGGAIIIDQTEALVSIDVNSAKFTKSGDIEETAFKTNIEAAKEIARQLRLRDIGGLFVIDFIDMMSRRNQRTVEEELRNAFKIDRVRVQLGEISEFGILTGSRQRKRSSLAESSRITCPRCLGHGTIRGIESFGLSIIRLLEEEALKENTAQVRAILPNEVTAYLLNEKRQAIIDIEKRQKVSLIIVPSAHLQTPQHEIERIRISDLSEKDEKSPSYKLAIKPEISALPLANNAAKNELEPAIKALPSTEPSNHSSVPGARSTHQPGILKKLFSFLFDKEESTSAVPVSAPLKPRYEHTRHLQKRKPGGRHQQRSRHANRHQRNSNQPRHENRDQRDSRPQHQTESKQPRYEEKDTRLSSATLSAAEPEARHAVLETRIEQEASRIVMPNPTIAKQETDDINYQKKSAATEGRDTPLPLAPAADNHSMPVQASADHVSAPVEHVPERKPRPRFHPQRNRRRHNGRREHLDKKPQILEGEDIYSAGEHNIKQAHKE